MPLYIIFYLCKLCINAKQQRYIYTNGFRVVELANSGRPYRMKNSSPLGDTLIPHSSLLIPH